MKSKLTILVLTGLLLSNPVLAYDDKTTHPALTDEIVDFYNLFFENKLTDKEKEWIVIGAMDEDTPPRWINHFYDPIYKTGWSGENTGIWPTMVIQYFSGKAFPNANPTSSLDWLHNQKLQSEYGEYQGNRTWERAIYEYANGNIEEAYRTLGYILHLIEDATVPDHTRNDTHAHELRYFTGDYGSPYEEFNKQYTRTTLDITDELKNQGYKPIVFDFIDQYLVSLAEYSNKYFFSKDTINDPKYSEPKIVREENGYGYGKDRNGEEFEVVRIITKTIKIGDEFSKIKNFTLFEEERKEIILPNYFTRLSREAIINGAGIIDLFHREGEKAKQNIDSVEKPPQETAKVSSLIDEFYAVFNFFSAVKEFAVSAFETISSKISPKIVLPQTQLAAPVGRASPGETGRAASSVQPPLNSKNNQVSEINLEVEPPSKSSSPTSESTSENLPMTLNEAKPTVKIPETQAAEIAQAQTRTKQNSNLGVGLPSAVSLPYPGFGGGGEAVNLHNLEVEPPNEPSSDNLAPAPPIISSPSDFLRTFTSAAITFQGTAEASSTIFNDFNSATTTTGQNNNWQMTLTFPQGTTTLNFFAKDAANNVSSSTLVELFVDSEGPLTPLLTIAECADSLAVNACLTATTTLHLNWSSEATDTSYFELSYGNLTSTTTATSTILSLNDNTVYTFSLRNRDQSNNWSEATTTAVEISTMPVVINEVAWAGTAASYDQDEWIELYNRTDKNINLADWILYSQTDSSPYLNLAGIIPAKNYYLIERTDDLTINDIAADLIVSFGNGLNNQGEVLNLSLKPVGQATTTIDQTALCGYGYYRWCPGDDIRYRTMERIDPDLIGADQGNWAGNIYSLLIANGRNAGGGSIAGTPKARNSVNYLIAKGAGTISENVLLTKGRSPYLVNDQIQVVSSGATLTIEPGVTIKFYDDAGMNFNGAAIKVQGAANEPVVFTSFYDDEYGGDTNRDATSTLASSGDWYGVDVVSGANGSIIDHAIFRYAGKYYTPTSEADRTIVKIQDTSDILIKNSIFEYSKAHGLVLINSTSTVENSIFRNNNNYSEQGKGLFVSGGNYSIKNNEFFQNQTGLYLSNAPAIVDANTFSNNTQKAVYSYGLIGQFTNNSASQNGKNGIVLSGNLAAAGSTSTLKAAGIPYVLSETNPAIPANSALLIESGAIIKGSEKGLQVNGRLTLDGENPGDIILTSLYDDSVGGDTDNNIASLPGPGDWPGINLASGASFVGRGFTLRYAGSQSYNGQDSAGLKMATSLANIANALFKANYPYGLFALANSELNISNSSFENHNYSGPWGIKASLAVYNSTSTLINISFINNLLGIASDAVSTWIASAVEFVGNIATTSPNGLF